MASNMMLTVGLVVLLASASHCKPADSKDGKSAQSTLSSRTANSFIRRGGDSDRDREDQTLLLTRDFNALRDHHTRPLIGTPSPTLVTVTPAPGIAVTPGVFVDPNLGSFGGTGLSNFPHTHHHPISTGGHIGSVGQFGSGLGGSVFGGIDERYLLSILTNNPNLILQHPEALVRFPMLVLQYPSLIQRYPHLRHYVSPFVLNLINNGGRGLDNRFGFRRVPQNHFGTTGGNVLLSGGFSGGLGGSSVDFSRPIDLNNRGVFASGGRPTTVVTALPSTGNIRF